MFNDNYRLPDFGVELKPRPQARSGRLKPGDRVRSRQRAIWDVCTGVVMSVSVFGNAQVHWVDGTISTVRRSSLALISDPPPATPGQGITVTFGGGPREAH